MLLLRILPGQIGNEAMLIWMKYLRSMTSVRGAVRRSTPTAGQGAKRLRSFAHGILWAGDHTGESFGRQIIHRPSLLTGCTRWQRRLGRRQSTLLARSAGLQAASSAAARARKAHVPEDDAGPGLRRRITVECRPRLAHLGPCDVPRSL